MPSMLFRPGEMLPLEGPVWFSFFFFFFLYWALSTGDNGPSQLFYAAHGEFLLYDLEP